MFIGGAMSISSHGNCAPVRLLAATLARSNIDRRQRVHEITFLSASKVIATRYAFRPWPRHLDREQPWRGEVAISRMPGALVSPTEERKGYMLGSKSW